MTSFTVQRFPCNQTVMTLAAEFAVHYGIHIDVIGPSLQYENIFMTNLALESDPVEPVWKHYRLHTSLFHTFHFSAQYNIAVFCVAYFCTGKYGNEQ